MQQDILQLIELQKLDNRIAELEEQVGTIPAYLQEAKEKLEKTQFDFEYLKNKVDTITKEKNDLSTEVAEKQSSLDRAQEKLAAVKNNSEYQAALKELDGLKKFVNDAEEKLMEMDESLEKLSSDFSKVESDKAEQESDFESKRTEKDETDSDAVSELEDLKKHRADVAATIKKSLIGRYERIRQARNNLAIVRVDLEVCTGCYMKVPPQLYVEVKKERAIHQCPNCQRFLYFRNEEGGDAETSEQETAAE